MDYLTVIFYSALFSLLIYKWRFFGDEKLPKFFFMGIFLMKVAAGIFYTYSFRGGDTTMYYNDANAIIYPELWRHPLKYLYLTFGPNGGTIPAFIQQQVKAMGYWGDSSAYMVVRFNAAVRLFSFGNFYVHAVFMAFVSMVGLMWLHKAFIKFTGSQNIFSVAAVFLIPSVLFWGSGVHKEGLLLFALGLFFYGAVLLSSGFNTRRLAGFLIGAMLVFIIRDFIFLLLFPGLIAFFIARSGKTVGFSFLVAYLILLLVGSFFPVFKGDTLLEIIAFKQNQFLAINAGNTQIDVKHFEPHFISFPLNLPMALRNAVLGPFFISPGSFQHLLVIAENAVLLLAAFALPLLNGKPRFNLLMIWFLFFSVTLFILIGLIVPNVGAIVRYRCLALPFLFLFLASGRKTA